MITIRYLYYFVAEAYGGAVGWGTALQARWLQVKFPMVSLEFFIDLALTAALWPGVDLACNWNEY
jgi:hypothetical protein